MDRLTGHDEHHNIADDDKYHLARRYYELLQARIDNYRKELPDGKSIGIKMAAFGDNSLFYLKDIHFADPALIAMCCTDLEGLPIEIVQDVRHLNVALMPLDAR